MRIRQESVSVHRSFSKLSTLQSFLSAQNAISMGQKGTAAADFQLPGERFDLRMLWTGPWTTMSEGREFGDILKFIPRWWFAWFGSFLSLYLGEWSNLISILRRVAETPARFTFPVKSLPLDWKVSGLRSYQPVLWKTKVGKKTHLSWWYSTCLQ